jgi:Protein of unknown function (DUF1116)
VGRDKAREAGEVCRLPRGIHAVSLRVATVGLDLMAEALRAQDVEVEAVEWRPPAGGEAEAVRLLAAAYGDDRIARGNREAIDRLQRARPVLRAAGEAGDLIPGLEGRTVLHAGPSVEWEAMCVPQRLAVCGACVFEGWAGSVEDAAARVARGDVRLAPAHELGAAGAMTGVVSPGMACWEACDEETGICAWSPLNDGNGEAFWLGVASPEAVERQRVLAESVAPAFAAALAARGPVEVVPLWAQGLAMGDDCHMRHQATTMLLLRETLPALVARAPERMPEVARVVSANGHFALTVTIAAARAALAGIVGVAGASLVTFISRNGTEAAVQLAGLPGRWFRAPAPLVGDALYRPGFGDAEAAPDIGDSALVECFGLGAAASAASPGVAAFLGGGVADAMARTREMGDICVARSERLTIPALDGEGTPLGVDARACLDLGATPLINTGILHRAEGGQIGAGVARTPLGPIHDALRALVEELGPPPG